MLISQLPRVTFAKVLAVPSSTRVSSKEHPALLTSHWHLLVEKKSGTESTQNALWLGLGFKFGLSFSIMVTLEKLFNLCISVLSSIKWV